jgi:hypothetical protein
MNSLYETGITWKMIYCEMELTPEEMAVIFILVLHFC